MNNFLLLKNIFIKRFFIILLAGMIGAFLAGMEKYHTKDVQIQSGTVVVSFEVQFTDPDEKEGMYPFQYDIFIKSVGNVCKFIYKLEETDTVDVSAINADWKKLSAEKKYKWMDKYVLVDFFGEGKCQFSVYADVNTPKDAEFFGEQGKKFLMVYLNSSLEELKYIKPNIQMDVRSMQEYKPEVVTLAKKNLGFKYAAIGFVLGVMLSTIALFFAALRKK